MGLCNSKNISSFASSSSESKHFFALIIGKFTLIVLFFMDISFLVNNNEKCLIINKIMHSYSIKYLMLNI